MSLAFLMLTLPLTVAAEEPRVELLWAKGAPGAVGTEPAGGHLASTAGTHFDDGKADAEDSIDKVSCRPDFLILCYPVVTLEPPYAHMGGKDADAKLVESLCNEKQVTDKTPPTFLFHTDADRGVVPENSMLFYLALKKAKVPAELHIYEKGNHGVGLAPGDPILKTWPDRLNGWLETRGLLKKQ